MTEQGSAWDRLLAREQEKEEERLAIIRRHAEAGVVFFDWKTAYISPEAEIGAETEIGAGVVIEGHTRIGIGCRIGHHSRITDSVLGDGVEMEQSIVLRSEVGDRSKIGPFAYLRPGCHIGSDAKVGDFVEVKNSTLGNGTKASHLTYIGDADIGDGVNLGCGVVFVNYNGRDKNRSVIEDGAFVGCNTNLIAPVRVGKNAYVAAGTTVTRNVPDGALCIARDKERHIEGWVDKRGLLKKKK